MSKDNQWFGKQTWEEYLKYLNRGQRYKNMENIKNKQESETRSKNQNADKIFLFLLSYVS